MPKDEVPPEHIWEDAQGLEQWWEAVENKRSDGMPTKRGRADSDDDDDDQGPSMTENDYARFLKQG